MSGRRCRAAVATVVAVVVLASCSSEPSAEEIPQFIVPNTVLADLVSRVACVGDVDVVVGPVDSADENTIAALTLDTPELVGSDLLVVSVPAVTTTINAPGGADPWVWLDPIRFAELSEAVGATLATTGRFEPELTDRCLARIRAEMTDLDTELYDATQAIPESARVVDVSLPGTLYFANRFEFGIDETSPATAAGRAISSDDLGDAANYDDMMRANVAELIEILTSG